MNFRRSPPPSLNASKITSKFVSIYSKLFLGFSPNQIYPHQDQDRFFSDLLDLKVDRPYLEGELNKLSKETCLGKLKPFLSALFKVCTKHIREARNEDIRKLNAIETGYIVISCVLSKSMTGWETMEVLAGSVAQSDTVFSGFTGVLDTIIGDPEAPRTVRHKVLQLALMYMCRSSQLSTGAYFLRRDFFSSVASLATAPETEEYTFEGILFLAILANYHKSDAAKLNPYLKRIRETTDGDFMRKLCWASNFALESSIKAYQDLADDATPPTLTSSLGSVITRLRPDRALSFMSMGQPRENFKGLPIEASVVLLPIYEFLRPNPLFITVFLEDLVSPPPPITEGVNTETSSWWYWRQVPPVKAYEALICSQTIRFLDFALCTSESYLPSPRAVHEFIYELVRSSSVLKKQQELLNFLEPPFNRPAVELSLEFLAHIMITTDFYREKISEMGAGIGNAKDAMKTVADDIEANGIHGARDMRDAIPPTRSQNVLDFGPLACADVLALIP
ncbi:hypothetical protein NLJ89_g1346 [Agrocybe chaxingu]|uniref:Uncharacterized protein n=1 Tax=Agrocybe chaxingu TaxID=84603 RepID=A0A9W8N089_9AGAR|nr:hypothetical protein NLJ89_g1346 [Agrocybe chaxingu]